MSIPVLRIVEGESSVEEAIRLEQQHFRQESDCPIDQVGLVEALVVLSGPKRRHRSYDQTLGLLVNKDYETKIVIWLGGIIGTVAHLAATHAELDEVNEISLQSALPTIFAESPELCSEVIALLKQPNHTLPTRSTQGSGKGERVKTIFRNDQLAPQSFRSSSEAERFKKPAPTRKKRPIPLEKTIGPDGISF